MRVGIARTHGSGVLSNEEEQRLEEEMIILRTCFDTRPIDKGMT